MNILNEQTIEKYKVVSSEIDRDGLNPIFLKMELADGHILKVELKLYDVDGVYMIIEEALENYYLMKNRKQKLKQIRNK